MRKTPEADLKIKYKKVLELGMVLSMVIMVLVFQTLRAIDMDEAESKTVNIEIEVTDIPPTEQFKRPPPPPRPSIPIPTESEDVPEDLTIEANVLDLSDIPPPPPPPDDEGDMTVLAREDHIGVGQRHVDSVPPGNDAGVGEGDGVLAGTEVVDALIGGDVHMVAGAAFNPPQ